MFPTVHGVVSQGGKAAPTPPPGGIAVVDVTTAAHDAVSSSHAIALPSGSGGLLLVIAKGAGGATNRGWGTPSGWNKVLSVNEFDSAWPTAVFTRAADGTEPSTLTFETQSSTFNPTSAGSALAAYRISGAHGDVEAGSSASDPPALTPSWGEAVNLWIAVLTSRRSDGAFTAPPANYVGLVTAHSPGESSSLSTAQLGAAYRILEAASENPGTFTFSGTLNGSRALTIAVRPA